MRRLCAFRCFFPVLRFGALGRLALFHCARHALLAQTSLTSQVQQLLKYLK